LPIEELKPLVIIEEKSELIALINNIFGKAQLQDILYRSSIDTNKLEPKRKTPVKQIVVKNISEKNITENDKLYEEMMRQNELKQKIKASA
jgi:hypothetical protein